MEVKPGITAGKNYTGLRDRIPVLTKICYGLGTSLDMWGLWLYPAVAFAVFNIYLGVDTWLVGLALTIIRIYDAVADPVVGWISDNFRSKHGRRRPFILVAGVLSGLGLPILFLVSPSWSQMTFLGVSVIFWYMIVSSLVFIPVISTFSIPYNSLGAELSPDYDERTSIMTYRSVMQKIFETGNYYALRFTNLAWFLLPGAGGKNTLPGIQIYTSILGVIMAIFAIIIFFRVKERYYDKVVVKTRERISIKSSFYETLKCRPFRMIMGMGGAFIMGTSMVGALGYFVSGLILKWAGFNADLATQSPVTILWIRAMLASIPVIGMLMAIFFILRMLLTKVRCAEIRVLLEERRGTV